MCVLSSVSSLAARDYYVATNSTPGAADRWSNAYTNLQTAFTAAGNGDTVYVAGHRFAITAEVSWTAKNNLSIFGGYAATNDTTLPGTCDPVLYPTRWTIKSGTVRQLQLNNVTNGRIERVTFTGGNYFGANGTGKGGAIQIINCGTVLLANCVLTNNICTDVGAAKGGALYTENAKVAVSNCLFDQNQVFGSGNGGTYGGAVHAASGTLAMRDCVVRSSVGNSGWQVCHGAVYAAAALVMRNCLVVGNHMKDLGDGVYLASGSGVLENCTVADNAGYGVYRAGGSVWMTNCVLWANGDDVYGSSVALNRCLVEDGDNNGTNGCLMSDPQFEYGYYLKGTSPALDQGTNAFYLQGAPYTTRTNGAVDTSRIDLGYHYRSAMDLAYRDIYVATNGNNTWAGTSWGTAYRTIGKALAMSRDGTVVHVGTGVFDRTTETFPLRFSGKSGVRVVGMGAGVTKINAAGSNMRVWDIQHLTRMCELKDLAIGGGYTNCGAPHAGTGDGGGLRVFYASDLRLTGCSVTNNRSYDSVGSVGGGCYFQNAIITLSNCTFRGNTVMGTGNGRGQGGGVHLSRSEGYFRDSVFDANLADCEGHVLNYGGGVYATLSTLRMKNCLVMNNQALPAGDGIYATNTTLRIENSTVACNGDMGVQWGGGTAFITNSILWGNGDDLKGSPVLKYCDIEDGDGNGTNGCISLDPLFQYGYYLNPASPCVNRGADTAAAVGLTNYSTQAAGTRDAGLVDLGYHYAAGADLQYADIYVATNGNNNWAGTNWVTAVRSITKAMLRVIDGGRVHVGPGRFTNGLEKFPLSLSQRNGIWLLGSGAGATVIDAAGANSRVFDYASVGGNSGVRGFTITGGYTNCGAPHAGTGDGGAFRLQNCAQFTIAECVVSNNQCIDTVGAYGGGVYVTYSVMSVSNSILHGNQAIGSGNGWGIGGGIHAGAGSQVYVDRTTFETNRAWGHPNSRGGGLYNSAAVRLRNCKLLRNDATMYGDGCFSTNASTVIANCTVIGSGGQGVHGGGNGLSVTNSILWSNGDDLAGTVAFGYCNIEDGDHAGSDGCISIEPRFVSTNDYHLQRDSPCVNAGMPQAWMRHSVDFDGSIRREGGRPDLGCYETGVGAGSVVFVR